MDPEGTYIFILTIIISIVICLYTAAEIRQEKDENAKYGLPYTTVSRGLLLLCDLRFLFLCGFSRIAAAYCLPLRAVFVILGIITPFCLGLALSDKLSGLVKILTPLMNVMNKTVTAIALLPVFLIFRLFRLDAGDEVTQEDVMDMVEDADEDEIDDDQKEMIENIFELDETCAGDIMTHRRDVTAFSGREKCKDIISEAVKSGFSRIPVYDGTIDTIVGFLYAKDLLSIMGDDKKMEMPVRRFVRKRMYVPEACAARELLVQFKKKHTQIAVVVDEYGGTSGIVTMEDILEEIVGNIQDEYDNEEEIYVQNEDGSYTAQASMRIEDLLDLFGIEPDEEEREEEDFDSIGGMIISKLERIPTSDEQAQIEYKGLLFTVLKVEDRRIVKVKVEKLSRENQSD